MLRVVDGRLAGVKYRSIAEALFPSHKIDSSSWAGDALREITIRLARDGLQLVEGGYRTLLRRPRRSYPDIAHSCRVETRFLSSTSSDPPPSRPRALEPPPAATGPPSHPAAPPQPET